ncbi:UNKNOWN [Stylonychia lemnae]|uniref:Uncharacterized protein n=1 Tax=Stylonychia lemnae TaxID=5949 RepID=A0A078AL44_STYLE|nr:UNKNOWN [Stylonychia lemnae]|eukprot:CDW83085.1 UNKNOWN [Stylonychia lemnae]
MKRNFAKSLEQTEIKKKKQRVRESSPDKDSDYYNNNSNNNYNIVDIRLSRDKMFNDSDQKDNNIERQDSLKLSQHHLSQRSRKFIIVDIDEYQKMRLVKQTHTIDQQSQRETISKEVVKGVEKQIQIQVIIQSKVISYSAYNTWLVALPQKANDSKLQSRSLLAILKLKEPYEINRSQQQELKQVTKQSNFQNQLKQESFKQEVQNFRLNQRDYSSVKFDLPEDEPAIDVEDYIEKNAHSKYQKKMRSRFQGIYKDIWQQSPNKMNQNSSSKRVISSRQQIK